MAGYLYQKPIKKKVNGNKKQTKGKKKK